MANRNTNSKKIVVPVTKLEKRDQIWSRQSRLKNRPQTSSQYQQAQRNNSKESLADLNEVSPPKKVQGINDEFRITAIRFYQGNMDERLSQPKRVTNRFVGFNEDSMSTIDHTPYDNMKKIGLNTTINKSSISTAADATQSQKNFFSQDMMKKSMQALPNRSQTGIKGE